jgi:hypothetical protein
MDASETAGSVYLAHLGYSAIVYEPDGKVPPDFLIDGRIAVEVRRLNQSEDTPEGPCGLEETAEPLHAAVTKVLSALGPPTNGVSWFVVYTFRRPLPPWRQLERTLAGALRRFQHELSDQPTAVRIARTFTLRLIRASNTYPTVFVLGGSSDHDGGGFIVGEMARNLRICIDEKTRKVARVLHRYPEWWLVLEDRIGYGVLDESDRQDLRSLISVGAPWSRIVLVNPLNPAMGFEL